MDGLAKRDDFHLQHASRIGCTIFKLKNSQKQTYLSIQFVVMFISSPSMEKCLCANKHRTFSRV